MSSAGESLRYAKKLFKADRELALAAVRHTGSALQHYARAARVKDRQAVLAAVSQDGLALRFVEGELRNDHEVFGTAVRQNPGAVRFLAKELCDEQFAMDLLEDYGELLVQWRAQESSLYAAAEGPSHRYLTQRNSLLSSVRQLGEDLNIGSGWMQAMTLLDAAASSRREFVIQKDLAVSSVTLVAKAADQNFMVERHEASIADVLGQRTLTEPVKKQIRSAEVQIFFGLGGRICLPSVGTQARLILTRLSLELAWRPSTSGAATVLPVLDHLVNRISEELTVRIIASARAQGHALAAGACVLAFLSCGLVSELEVLPEEAERLEPLASSVKEILSLVAPAPLAGEGLDFSALARAAACDAGALRSCLEATLVAWSSDLSVRKDTNLMVPACGDLNLPPVVLSFSDRIREVPLHDGGGRVHGYNNNTYDL